MGVEEWMAAVRRHWREIPVQTGLARQGQDVLSAMLRLRLGCLCLVLSCLHLTHGDRQDAARAGASGGCSATRRTRASPSLLSPLLTLSPLSSPLSSPLLFINSSPSHRQWRALASCPLSCLGLLWTWPVASFPRPFQPTSSYSLATNPADCVGRARVPLDLRHHRHAGFGAARWRRRRRDSIGSQLPSSTY
ncbi:hypothetical protein IWX90DRAFT_47702 [Phyllosticta citrichinensis]|uniref:Uncharacterized protein n=1 Tax=Phyllosticta citrichinensis TaxID=1130410 RepID=A0ABR1XI92_9PEZI